MIAIIDSRTSKVAIENLSKFANDILLFETKNIVYESISCHPDIFIFQDSKNLIIAPNSPLELFDFLRKNNVNFVLGNKPVGNNLNNSVLYNCVSTNDLFLHKANKTDETVLKENLNKKFINLPQAYTRCSLTHIGNNSFITSDKGIENVLNKNNLECFYFAPDEIKINVHKNGFFGGSNGIYGNKIFFNGNILKHKDGQKLYQFLNSKEIDIIFLHDDFLYDGGGIFFLDE